MTSSQARGRLAPDMGRKVLVTIEIPLSLREKVRSSWKKNGTSLRSYYSEIFKRGVTEKLKKTQ